MRKLIDWKSSQQISIALSSIEAEYINQVSCNENFRFSTRSSRDSFLPEPPRKEGAHTVFPNSKPKTPEPEDDEPLITAFNVLAGQFFIINESVAKLRETEKSINFFMI
jgi:hypothetical protein